MALIAKSGSADEDDKFGGSLVKARSLLYIRSALSIGLCLSNLFPSKGFTGDYSKYFV